MKNPKALVDPEYPGFTFEEIAARQRGVDCAKCGRHVWPFSPKFALEGKPYTCTFCTNPGAYADVFGKDIGE